MMDCILINGSIPVDEFCALVGAWEKRGEDMILDARLAAKLGTTFVFGPKAACYEWRAMLGIDGPEREREE
jgi:hypothetical protein